MVVVTEEIGFDNEKVVCYEICVSLLRHNPLIYILIFHDKNDGFLTFLILKHEQSSFKDLYHATHCS